MYIWEDHNFPNFEFLVAANDLQIVEATNHAMIEAFNRNAATRSKDDYFNAAIGVGRQQYALFESWKNATGAFTKYLPQTRHILGDEYVGLHRNDTRNLENVINDRMGDNAFPLYRRLRYNRAMNSDQAAITFERDLKSVGGLDAIVTGFGDGDDPHFFFNGAGTALDSRTRLVASWDAVDNQNDALLDGHETRPSEYLTIGLGTAADAHDHIIMARGADKAFGLQQIMRGAFDPQYPITYLHALNNDLKEGEAPKQVKIIADRAAMSLIS